MIVVLGMLGQTLKNHIDAASSLRTGPKVPRLQRRDLYFGAYDAVAHKPEVEQRQCISSRSVAMPFRSCRRLHGRIGHEPVAQRGKHNGWQRHTMEPKALQMAWAI